MLKKRKKYYDICIRKSCKIFTDLDTLKIPELWNVSGEFLRDKINDFFEKQWIDGCFSNFVETLQQNF